MLKPDHPDQIKRMPVPIKIQIPTTKKGVKTPKSK
jgi:hypothetical protein